MISKTKKIMTLRLNDDRFLKPSYFSVQEILLLHNVIILVPDRFPRSSVRRGLVDDFGLLSPSNSRIRDDAICEREVVHIMRRFSHLLWAWRKCQISHTTIRFRFDCDQVGVLRSHRAIPGSLFLKLGL